jgi:hypothetical protein
MPLVRIPLDEDKGPGRLTEIIPRHNWVSVKTPDDSRGQAEFAMENLPPDRSKRCRNVQIRSQIYYRVNKITQSLMQLTGV